MRCELQRRRLDGDGERNGSWLAALLTPSGHQRHQAENDRGRLTLAQRDKRRRFTIAIPAGAAQVWRIAEAMSLKLEKVLSSLGVISAIAYVLGWLQAFYYFDTFGIRLASVGMTPQDYLLNSWFVIENVVFFLILVKVVITTRRWWLWMIGVGYFLIPIAAHYAFFVPDWSAARFLIEYRHTLLKFIPFGLLFGVMLADRVSGSHPASRVLKLPQAPDAGWIALLVIIVGAWSVSVAKHFGSFDANLELRHPDKMLATVRLHQAAAAAASEGLTPVGTLYLVHATPNQLFIWDSGGFTFGQPDQKITIHVIGRDKVTWFETTKKMQIQRGSFIF